MNSKTPVYRTCVVTREKTLKEYLFRACKSSSGVIFDETQTVLGRGAYIKKM